MSSDGAEWLLINVQVNGFKTICHMKKIHFDPLKIKNDFIEIDSTVFPPSAWNIENTFINSVRERIEF